MQTIKPSRSAPRASTATPPPAAKHPSAQAAVPELPPKPVVNWNGKIVAKPRAVYTPKNEQDVIKIMQTESKVRVLGSRHSFNEQLSAAGDAAMINMVNLNAIQAPHQYPDGSYGVWVQAGALVKDVSTALHRHGLALEHLPTSEKITVGGAVANGAHGSGLTSPATLSEQVLGMHVIDSDGNPKVVSRAELPLYRINLGSLGVVTRIELRVVPDFDLVTKDDKLVGEDAVVAALEPKRLVSEVSGYQNVMYILNPNQDPKKSSLVRWGYVKADAAAVAAERAGELQRKLTYDERSSVETFTIFKAFEAAANATGPAASATKQFLRDRFQPREPRTIGRSGLMYQLQLDHPAHDVSYGVPIERAQEAFIKVMAKLRELGYEAPIPMSMRFLKGTDTTLLGMNSGRDVAVFELVTSVLFDEKSGALRPDVKAAQEAFEAIMIELGGRPHWGKEFTKSPKDRHAAGAWQLFHDESAKVGRKLANDWARTMTPVGSS